MKRLNGWRKNARKPQREKKRLEAAARQQKKEERLKAAQHDRDRLEAERESLGAGRQMGEEQERLKHEPEAQPWTAEIRYEVLLRLPEVRDLIACHASQGRRPISGEDFLKLCDKAFVPGAPLADIRMDVQRTYAGAGWKTGAIRTEFFTAPTGKALVAAICSMARHGQPLNRVAQGQTGCLLNAGIQFDMRSWGGNFLVGVQQQDKGSSVQAATVIKGQFFDWGKSARILDNLFSDLRALPI